MRPHSQSVGGEAQGLIPPAMQAIFAAGGEVGRLMPAVDWADTPVGPVAGWPQSLRTAISICLSSRHPMVIWWGPEQAQLYNDAFSGILGAKHPSIGRPGREVWPEIWDIIGPMLDGVRLTGEATWSYDHYLPVNRRGFLEEAYFTYSYSPVRDEVGQAIAVFTAVTETTERVLGDRRLRTLRELAHQAAEARGAEAACAIAAAVLKSNPSDMPFALIYLLKADGTRADLAGSTLPRDHALAVDRIDLTRDASPWRLADAISSGQRMAVDLPTHVDVLSTEGEPVSRAVVLPMAQPGQGGIAACVVAGVGPRLALDSEYESFFDLVGGQVSKAIADAQSYEAERHRAESLAELDRAKTVFFSNVSHEFRTPLTLLLGPLEDAIADPRPTPESMRNRAELAHRNAMRLLKLVNTLLDFSRLEAGRIEATYSPVDLGGLTADLAQLFRPALERGGVDLQLEIGPLPEPVHVDREMWEKVVLNLLSNAFKFTFDGHIRVAITEREGCAELIVEDTGTGIPETELPLLFGRFHRVQGARARTHEGTGIGLSLVHQLVALHGGTVTATSEVGRGSTFSVRIPLGTAHLPADRLRASRQLGSTALEASHYVGEALRWLPDAASSVPDQIELQRGPVAVSPSEHGARILVADDNQDMRQYLVALLSEHWVVEAVGDGPGALASALASPPDLVLTDVMMPGFDGFELLRRLRDEPTTAQIPVVMLSARSGPEAVVEGIDRGADDYLVKPFSARELIARVRSNLELARARLAAGKLAAAEEEARRMTAVDKAKSRFLNLASHELRTPLAVIRGYVSMLQDGSLASDDQRQSALRVVASKTTEMDTLVNQLLDAARLEDEGPVGARIDIDIGELAASVTRDFEGTLGDRHQVLYHCDNGPYPVTADGEGLRTVMKNLLGNAVKYSPAGGVIKVRVTAVDRKAIVSVADEGIGIADADLPQLFTKFGRIVTPDNSDIQGTGLGLYISREIVRQEGGDITVESVLGSGTTFRLHLPLARPDAA